MTFASQPLLRTHFAAGKRWLTCIVFVCGVLLPGLGRSQSSVISIDPPSPTTSDSVTLGYTFIGNDLELEDLGYSIVGGVIQIRVKFYESVFPHTTMVPISIDVGKLPAGSFTANLNYSYRNFTDDPSYFGPYLIARTDFSVSQAISTISVVEFFHPGLNHYFLSADPDEIAMLDANVQTLGWAKTGLQFLAYAADTVLLGTSPVCRFYGSVTPGPNSHFYTLDPTECNFLKQLQQTTPATLPRWNFEGIAFVAARPQGIGSCPAEYPLAVRRFYNNRALQADSNHRYVIDDAVAQQMRAAGWLDEGVVMCGSNARNAVPPFFSFSPPAPTTSDFVTMTVVDVMPGALLHVDGVLVSMNGTVISVTSKYTYAAFAAGGLYSITAQLGQLAAAQYSIRFYAQGKDVDEPTYPTPQFRGSTTLRVSPTPVRKARGISIANNSWLAATVIPPSNPNCFRALSRKGLDFTHPR